MRFCADEGVDRAIVERLRTAGHEVLYVAEMARGITDQEVLAMAREQGSPLITNDKDFGELVFRQGLAQSGVVLLRLAGLAQAAKAEIVSKAVALHGDSMSGAFCVIAPGSLRIRPREI